MAVIGPTSPSLSRRAGPLPGRRGFSFVEIMFAIVVLGIGFIMLAAMFPVAIRQTRANLDGATGDAVCRSGANVVAALMDDDYETGDLYQSFAVADVTPLVTAVRGEMIAKADPRYAWVPLAYRLQGNLLDVTLVGATCATRSTYSPQDAAARDDGQPGTLDAKAVEFFLTDNAGGTDTIRFDSDDSMVADGTFVVLTGGQSDLGGTIYRVGEMLDASTRTWAVAVGYDVAPAAVGPLRRGTVLGRARSDDGSTYDGPAQDICVWQTHVRVR